MIWVCLEAGSPLIRFTSLAFSIIALRPFATNVKSNGDNGFPCSSFLLYLISFPVAPLNIMFVLVEINQLSIHPSHFGPKFLERIISMRQSQLTLSYAFSKSSLSKKSFLFSFFTCWITSCVINIWSNMFLPFMNPGWYCPPNLAVLVPVCLLGFSIRS